MKSVASFRTRFTRPVFLWSMTALLTEVLVQWHFKHSANAPMLRMLALLPLVPMVFFILALARTILKMDELQKRICLESLSIAFLLTLFLTLAFAGLERAGLHKAPWDDLGSYMLFLWACAYVFTARRYQ
jgi:hypothetical protein